MKTLFFSCQDYERPVFTEMLAQTVPNTSLQFSWQDTRLTLDTAALTEGYDAICTFVNDNLSTDVLERLSLQGVKLIALLCAAPASTMLISRQQKS